MGSLIAGVAALNEGKYRSEIDRINQGVAGQAAESALSRGAFQAGVIQSAGSQMIGKQKAGYAASGVDVGQGSPLQAMADTRMMSTLDAQIAKNNAAREAWGYRTGGYEHGLQSQLDIYRGQTGAVAGVLGETAQSASQAMQIAAVAGAA